MQARRPGGLWLFRIVNERGIRSSGPARKAEGPEIALRAFAHFARRGEVQVMHTSYDVKNVLPRIIVATQNSLVAAWTKLCGAVLASIERWRVELFMDCAETRFPQHSPCPLNRHAGGSAAALGHDLPCISVKVRMDMEEPFSCLVDAKMARQQWAFLYHFAMRCQQARDVMQ